MTVAELIEHLKQFPPEMKVYYCESFFGYQSGEVTPSDIRIITDREEGIVCHTPVEAPYLKLGYDS